MENVRDLVLPYTSRNAACVAAGITRCPRFPVKKLRFFEFGHGSMERVYNGIGDTLFMHMILGYESQLPVLLSDTPMITSTSELRAVRCDVLSALAQHFTRKVVLSFSWASSVIEMGKKAKFTFLSLSMCKSLQFQSSVLGGLARVGTQIGPPVLRSADEGIRLNKGVFGKSPPPLPQD